jgi:hypothetical protein
MVCLKDGNWQISLYQWLAEVGQNPSLVLAFLLVTFQTSGVLEQRW